MRRLPVFTKQWVDLWREKTFFLVIALIVFVILSLSLLIAVTAFVYNPEMLVDEDIKIGYIGPPLLEEFGNKIVWLPFDATEDALAAFDEQEVDAVITYIGAAPARFDVVLPQNPVRRSLTAALIKDVFQNLEDSILSGEGLLTPLDVRSSTTPLRGMDKIYEILFGFAIPLFLLIPTFLIGNLFVDNIAEDFERKNNQVLFTAYNPLRYVGEVFLFGLVLNTVLVVILQSILYLRFSFLVQPLLVFLYGLLFFMLVAQIAALFVFIFKTKMVSQLAYSFAILSLFLFSPYVSWMPVKTMSLAMLGIEGISWIYLSWIVLANVLLFFGFRFYIKRAYYA